MELTVEVVSVPEKFRRILVDNVGDLAREGLARHEKTTTTHATGKKILQGFAGLPARGRPSLTVDCVLHVSPGHLANP